LVQRYDALEDQVRTLHEEVAGRVRVVSIYSVGLHLMNRYLQQFLSQYPKANVRLEYQHPHRVYEAIEKDQADIGLVSYPRASRSVEAIPWREEPMVLVCAASHPLAQREVIDLELLQNENFIGFDADLVIRRELDRVLQLHDIEVRVVMEFDNVETMKRAVEIGAGVSILPEPAVAAEVAGGTLRAVPLATDELVRPLGIIHRRGKDLSSTTRRFIDLLQNEGTASGELAAPVNSTIAADDPLENGLLPGPNSGHVVKNGTDGHSLSGAPTDGSGRTSAGEHLLATKGPNGNGGSRRPALAGSSGRVKAK
jgi:DNA-binding transcriptional LysR family regulator